MLLRHQKQQATTEVFGLIVLFWNRFNKTTRLKIDKNNMKTIIKIILVFLPLMGSFASTQDTIYVMRSGMVVYKKAITDIDSISFENTIFNRRSIVNKIAADKNYSIFYQGLVATGLVDSLKVDRDKSYNYHNYQTMLNPPFTQGSGSVDQLPIVRRYGFTVLM